MMPIRWLPAKKTLVRLVSPAGHVGTAEQSDECARSFSLFFPLFSLMNWRPVDAEGFVTLSLPRWFEHIRCLPQIIDTRRRPMDVGFCNAPRSSVAVERSIFSTNKPEPSQRWAQLATLGFPIESDAFQWKEISTTSPCHQLTRLATDWIWKRKLQSCF